MPAFAGMTSQDYDQPWRALLSHRLRLQLVPPWANAGHAVVVAFHHLHRLTEALLGIGEAKRARLVLIFLGQPGAVVAPHAGAFLALVSLPVWHIDITSAPAVLDHEIRRVP